MEAAKPVFSVCTHDGGCAYGSRAIYSTHFKEGIDVLSAIPHSIPYFGRAPLLVSDTGEVVSPSATNTEFDINYIPYTVCTLVVYSSVYLLSTVFLYTTYCPVVPVAPVPTLRAVLDLK